MNEDLRKFIQSDRRDFKSDPLESHITDHSPVNQFGAWFQDVIDLKLPDPYAFVLATAGMDGTPAGRVLYMRDLTERGLTFFTNYNSEKGRELSENPRAACVFFWSQLNRQVRINGRIEKLSSSESDDYFNSRPRESRIGAWASNQSSVIANRKILDDRVKELTAEYEGKDVPRPPHWGGYMVIPVSFEFWQGRESRLHDRLWYERNFEGNWKIVRLSP